MPRARRVAAGCSRLMPPAPRRIPPLGYNPRVIELPFPVVLASQSPRRRELLSQLVAKFEVAVVDLDEANLTREDPWGTAETLAQAKAAAVAENRPGCIVIGGDTVVAVPERRAEGQVAAYTQLGKPGDPQEARDMLRRLSGVEHEVITGISVVTPHGTEVFSVTTGVVFRELTDAEIVAYVDTGEPMDKAGAYAIQGGAAKFVDRIDGPLSNVIGLPVEELALRLTQYGEMVRAASPAPK
jgi:septum formation protein